MTELKYVALPNNLKTKTEEMERVLAHPKLTDERITAIFTPELFDQFIPKYMFELEWRVAYDSPDMVNDLKCITALRTICQFKQQHNALKLILLDMSYTVNINNQEYIVIVEKDAPILNLLFANNNTFDLETITMNLNIMITTNINI